MADTKERLSGRDTISDARTTELKKELKRWPGFQRRRDELDQRESNASFLRSMNDMRKSGSRKAKRGRKRGGRSSSSR